METGHPVKIIQRLSYRTSALVDVKNPDELERICNSIIGRYKTVSKEAS